MSQAAYGQLMRREGRAVLEYRRHLNSSPDKVWRALTEPDQLAAWFPTTIDGDRRPGAPLTFRFEHVEVEPMPGEMVSCEPPSLLEFLWGSDVLRFVLEADGDGTLLTFTVTLDQLGKATRDGAGWHQSLEGLERVLSTGATAYEQDADQWRVLRDAYAERFGAEASVLGPPREWEEKYGDSAS